MPALCAWPHFIHQSARQEKQLLRQLEEARQQLQQQPATPASGLWGMLQGGSRAAATATPAGMATLQQGVVRQLHLDLHRQQEAAAAAAAESQRRRIIWQMMQLHSAGCGQQLAAAVSQQQTSTLQQQQLAAVPEVAEEAADDDVGAHQGESSVPCSMAMLFTECGWHSRQAACGAMPLLLPSEPYIYQVVSCLVPSCNCIIIS